MELLKEQLLILISTPIYLLVISAEILLSHWQNVRRYTLKDTITNVYLMLFNGGIDLGFRIVYMSIFQIVFSHRMFHPHVGVAYWLFLLVAEDFLYYWLHRFDHEVRFFWATHVTHHSSEEFNLTVGFRSSVFQPFYRFFYFLPLPFLGFAPLDILFIYAVTQLWGIFVHTKLIHKMGFLEHILVTPSHHRVHHASNPKYLDKNMGMFLILWDKMFGTFQEELTEKDYQPIAYGLTKNFENKELFNVVFHEWMQIADDVFQPEINPHQRFQYLFGPPGYSHDGSRKTSKELRQMESGLAIEETYQAFSPVE